MKRERNRTVSRFLHNGKTYKIHGRSYFTSDGKPFETRFVLDDKNQFVCWANNTREARQRIANLEQSNA